MSIVVSEDFQTFAHSVSLALEFASPNPSEGYLNLFSYLNEGKKEYLMYLYGENQFDTAWEYDYHDFLTAGRTWLHSNDRVLVLGSGDLMNHRFLRSFETDLIDIDPFMTNLAKTHPLMMQLNQYVPAENYRIHTMDANIFLEENRNRIAEYQYVVIDFPVMISPVSDAVKKFGLEHFFSREMFVDILLKNLSPDGLLTMQADDTVVHEAHEAYFRSLLVGTDIHFCIYSLAFAGTKLHQYFYMFTKNERIFQSFCETVTPRPVRPGLFRKDDHFMNLFERLEKGGISYESYVRILSEK
jgi:hypothetical protein